MRRRRLQHAADILCRMFCGWRLANSYRDLALLGSGTLHIDALTGSCSFNGSPVEPPTIAGELHIWLDRDLQSHRIPRESLVRAEMTARLVVKSLASKPKRLPVHFLDTDGKPIRSGQFYRCEISCESEVATDEALYRSSCEAVESWPASWPSP